MSWNGLKDNGIKDLSEALGTPDNAIRELELSGNQIGNGGVLCLCCAIGRHKAMAALALDKNYFDDASSEAILDLIEKNQGLKYLKLSETNLKIKNIQQIKLILRNRRN